MSNTREYKGLRKLFQEVLKVRSLNEINAQLNPQMPKPVGLSLEEQQYLISIALILASYIREIHYNHNHQCKPQKDNEVHSAEVASRCIYGAYKYITEIGD